MGYNFESMSDEELKAFIEEKKRCLYEGLQDATIGAVDEYAQGIAADRYWDDDLVSEEVEAVEEAKAELGRRQNPSKKR